MAVLTGTVLASEAGAPAPDLVLDIAVGAVSVAVVPLLVRWPIAVTLLLSVLCAVSPAATPAATMAVLLVACWRVLPQGLLVAGAGIAAHLILSPAVTRRLMRRAVVQEDTRERAGRQLAALSPRELEVVQAIGAGQTNAEIAAGLLMSVPTVKAHVTHVLTKAGLANRTQIALLAHDAGLA